MHYERVRYEGPPAPVPEADCGQGKASNDAPLTTILLVDQIMTSSTAFRDAPCAMTSITMKAPICMRVYSTRERGVKALQPQLVNLFAISVTAFRHAFTMASATANVLRGEFSMVQGCSNRAVITKERGMKALQPQLVNLFVISVMAFRHVSATMASATLKVPKAEPSSLLRYGSRA